MSELEAYAGYDGLPNGLDFDLRAMSITGLPTSKELWKIVRMMNTQNSHQL